MLESILGRLVASLGVVLRTLRAFFMRFVTSFTSRIRSITSVTRQAAKIGPKVLDAAASTGKKPAKREDYVETGNLLIAKSFLITVILTIIIGGILLVTVVWPWIVSTFLTKHMWDQNEKVGNYNGKVVLYYDKEKTMPEFSGKLEKGVRQGKGITYDKNNLETFNGVYLDGEFEGKGKTFNEGVPIYDGVFKEGKYNGEGKLYDENGFILYEGEFEEDVYQGKGKLYDMGELIYDGNFEKGEYSGNGIEYRRGVKVYDGKFEDGLYEGKGRQYKSGKLVYDGEFSAGKRSGHGVEYSNGKVVYKGDFEEDLYNGNGVAYNKSGSVAFKGDFVDGYYSGEGILNLDDNEIIKGNFDQGSVVGDAHCFIDDKLWYEGSLADYVPDGDGKIYNNGVMIYDGPIIDGTIDGYSLTGMTMDELTEVFQKKAVRNVQEDGFSFYYPKLGATAAFSFATSEDEPRVKKFYLTSCKASKDAHIMSWKKVKDFSAFANKNSERLGQMKRKAGEGTNPISGKKEHYTSFKGDEFRLTLWSKDSSSDIDTYEWEAVTDAGSAGTDEGEETEEPSVTDAADAAQKNMNDLLEKIGLDAPGDDDAGGGADAGAAAGGTDAGAGADAGTAAAAGGADAGAATAAAAGGADAGTAAAAGGAATAAAAGGADAGTAAAAGGAATSAAAGGADSGAAAATAVAKSPYYGTAAPTETIKKAPKKDKNKVVKNMVLYYAAAEKVTAAKQKNEMIEKSINKANTDAKIGEDTEERLRSLKKEAKSIQLEITAATAEMAQYAQEITALTGGDSGAGADMSQLIVMFDVSAIDTDKLAQASVQNALAQSEEDHEAAMQSYKDAVKKNERRLERAFENSGLEERMLISWDDVDYEYAQRYNELKDQIQECFEELFKIEKPKQGEINDQEIYKLLQTQMVQMQLAGENIKAAKDEYAEAVSYQQEVEKKFKTGRATEDELNDAKMQVMDCCSALNADLASFAAIASDMNDVSGGYISESSGWLADAFKEG